MFKKKLYKLTAALLIALVAAFGAAGAASAATGPTTATPAAPKPIKVFLDSTQLKFDVNPIIKVGKVYVGFRTIFEALDYKVSYDSKTKFVTAVSPDGDIKLELGTSESFVNGVATEPPVRIVLYHSRTLVPLRFIAESTGLNVSWDPKERIVRLTHTQSELYSSVADFLDRLTAAMNKRDVDGYMALIDPKMDNYDLTKSAVDYYLPQLGAKNKWSNLKLIKWDADHVTITYTFTSAGDGTDFYLDRQIGVQAELTRSADSKWMLTSKSTLSQKLASDDALKKEATAPDSDKQAIFSQIDDAAKGFNSESLSAATAAWDQNSPYYSVFKDALGKQFMYYDLKTTIETKTLINFDDKTAYVYVVQKTEKSYSGSYENNRTGIVEKWTKNADGKWIMDPSVDTISYEKL